MMKDIYFILFVLGLIEIIYNERIFGFFRGFFFKIFPYSIITKILKCKSCLSFWVSFFCCFIFYKSFLTAVFLGVLVLYITKATYFLFKMDKYD